MKNTTLFIVRKIAFSSKRSFSSFIIRIAVAAVAMSVATMIIATSLVNGFQKEIRNKVFGFWAHINIVPFSLTKSFQEQGVYKYQDFYLKKNLPGVAHIQSTALKGGLLKTKDNFDGIVIRGAGDDFDWKFFKEYLVKGNVINTKADETSKGILVSTATASRLQIDTGDKVIVNFMDKGIRARPFVVQGLFDTGLEDFDKQYVIADIRVIQQLNGWGKDTVGGFEVFLNANNLFRSRFNSYIITVFGSLLPESLFNALSADPLDVMADEIFYAIENPTLDVQTIKQLNPGIFDWLDLQTMNELIILSLMVIVAVMNMITALLILILERTNMIGILKALGADNAFIRRLFIYYSIVIITAGIFLGNFIGLGLCFLQKHFSIVKLPKESYYISVAPVDVDFIWVIAINLITIAICVLALILPSSLANKISPVKAIRFS